MPCSAWGAEHAQCYEGGRRSADAWASRMQRAFACTAPGAPHKPAPRTTSHPLAPWPPLRLRLPQERISAPAVFLDPIHRRIPGNIRGPDDM